MHELEDLQPKQSSGHPQVLFLLLLSQSNLWMSLAERKKNTHTLGPTNLESIPQNKYSSVVTVWDFTSSKHSRDRLAGQPAFGYQTWLSRKPSFDFSKGWSRVSDCSVSLHSALGRYQCACINALEQVNMAHGESNCVGELHASIWTDACTYCIFKSINYIKKCTCIKCFPLYLHLNKY